MILANMLGILEMHLECLFVNLGYSKCATFVSLFGAVVETAANWLFIYELGLGIWGAAITVILVRAPHRTPHHAALRTRHVPGGAMVQTRFVRLAVWGFLVWWFGLVATLWSRESASQEALLTLAEFWEFLAQGLPKVTTTSDRLTPPNHPLTVHGEVATNFAPCSNPCMSTVSRDLIEEGRQVSTKYLLSCQPY